MSLKTELTIKAVVEGSSEIKKLGNDIKKDFGNANKSVSALGKSFAGIGRQVAGLAAGFLGVAGAIKAVGLFSDFNKALGELATISNFTAEETDKLRKSFVDLSAEFGTSAANQASTFYQIVSAGITDATEAQDTLIASNKLAVGGLADVGSSVDIITGILNAFTNESIDAEQAADVLFTTVKLGKTTVSELSTSLGKALPSANALGVSFREVAGTVAQLTTQSIPTAEAVTKLNAVFTGLLTGQDKAKKILGENADLFTLQALRTKGLTQFLKDLTNATGGSEVALTKLLGSSEAVTAVLALQADGFQGVTDKINELSDASGAADEAFKRINATISQQLKILFSNLAAIVLDITVGGEDEFVATLQSINEGLKNFRNEVGSAIDEVIVKIKSLGAILLIVFGPALLGSLLAVAKKNLFVIFFTLDALVAKTLITINGFLIKIGLLPVALKGASVGAKALAVSLNLLKGAASLGLLLVFDNLISTFIRFKDAGADTSEAITVSFLNLRGSILKALAAVFEQIAKLPVIGDTFKELAEGFRAGAKEADQAVIDFRKSLDFQPPDDDKIDQETKKRIAKRKAELAARAAAEKAARDREAAARKAARLARIEAAEKAAKELLKIEKERQRIMEAVFVADLASVKAGVEQINLINNERVADAQIAGASEEEVNELKKQNLRELIDQLNLAKDATIDFNLQSTDPRVQEQSIALKQNIANATVELKRLSEADLTPLQLAIKDVRDSLATIPSLSEGAASAFASFSNQANAGFENLASTGLNSLTNAFVEIANGTKTASQAFEDFGRTVLNTLIKIAIQKAITAAVGSAFSNGGSVSGVGGGGGNGPGASRFNTGGAVFGPGSSTSDSIPAWLSNKEYVIRAKSAQDMGIPLLNAINKFGSKGLAQYLSEGMSSKLGAFRNKASSSKASFRAPKFQDGGEVTTGPRNAGGMPNLTVNIENRSAARISAIQPEGPNIEDTIKGIVYSVILEDAEVGGPLTRLGAS